MCIRWRHGRFQKEKVVEEKRREEREREFLSLNLFVVKRRRRGRLVWFGLVTTPIRKRTYEREYEGGPRFYT